MKIRIILSLLLVITIACSKDSTEPETLSPESTISMALDYQSREYELGEVIEATLTITEKNPAADYFLLNTSCNGGKAVATVDGHELQWQAEQQIPYEIVNDEFSSKVLHLKITPQAGTTAKQPFNFGIYAISDGGTKVEKRIYAVSVNTAEIITNVECITPTINLEQQCKFILILVGLALCLTVAAQEKAKTTNVQGYALAIDNAFYSFKESTKAITDQNSRRGFDMQFFFTQKADYPIMGIANIAGAGMLFTVRNTKIAKEYSANSTVVLECIGLDNTSPFNIIFDFGDSAEDFCYPWSFTLKAPDMMVTASFRDKDGIKLVSEDTDYKEVFKVLQAKYKEHYNIK